ncbi:glycosyltransferase family 25 protein [Brucellaceae bacterium C25G]
MNIKTNECSFHMLTLLINLDRSNERLVYMQGLLSNLDIGFERIPAIDGKILSHDVLKKHQTQDNEKHTSILTPSEIGCFLSHRKAWQRLLDSDDNFALVLEDDISVSADLRLFLSDESWIPANAEIIKVEAYLNKKIKFGKSPFPIHNDRELYRLMSGHMGGAAYFISRQKAKQLLKETANFVKPVDVILFENEYLSSSIVYQMIPALVRQYSVSSDPQPGIFSSTIERDEIKLPHKKSNTLTRCKKEVVRNCEKIKVLLTKYTGLGAYIVKTVTFR